MDIQRCSLGRRSALLLFALLVFCGRVAAQQVVYEQTVSKDAWIKALPKDTSSALYKTLAVLSRHTGKPYQKEGLRYSWQQTVRIVESEPDNFRFLLYIENFQSRNATTFKSIPVSRYLIPARTDLSASVVFSKKALDVKETNLDLKNLLAGNAYQRVFKDSTPNKARPRVTVQYSNIEFDDNARPDLVLDSVLTRIDNYFSSKEELALIISRAALVPDKQEPDSILAHSARVIGYTSRFKEIQGITVSKELVGQNEAADFDRLLIETDSALSAAARASVALQQGLDELLYKKAFQFYRFGKRAEARRYLGQTLRYNPSHEPALARLCAIYLEQHHYDSAARMLVRNSGAFQGLHNQRLVERAAKGLEKQSLSAARNPDDESLKPAIGLLDSLCKSFPGYRCPDLSASAASGVIRSDFQKLINNARSQASQNHFDEAESLAEQALAFSKANNMPSANEEAAQYLLKQVRDRHIQMLTYQAREAFRKGADSAGLSLAKKAYDLTVKAGSQPEILKGVINSGVKDIITSTVNESLVQAKEGNARKARDLRRSAYQVAVNFNLEEEPDIEAVFKTVKTVSLGQDCNRKQADFTRMLSEGRAEAAASEYLKAAESFDNAVALSKSDEECLISSAPARSEMARIQKPVRYLRQLEKASRFVDRGTYDSAFHAINEGQRLAKGLSPQQAGIIVPFLDFTVTRNEPQFSAYAIRQLSAMGKPDSAVVIFKSLPAKQKAKGPVSQAIGDAAEALARRDFKLLPRQDAGHYIATYFKGEKAPKAFEKPYLAAWKQQERSL